MNRRLPMEQTSHWSFMPALPSFLRPLPPLGSIGTLEPLPVPLDRSLLKPLPPLASGRRLDQLFDDPVREGLGTLDISPVLHTEEIPLTQLLTTMQEYNLEVLEFKDASKLTKNAKKRRDRPPKQDNPLKAQDGKQVLKRDGDDRLNINKPWTPKNSKAKRAARMFIHRLERRKTLSTAAQFAIRTGKWRRNTSRGLDKRVPQERRSAGPIVPAGDSGIKIHIPPPSEFITRWPVPLSK